MLFVNNWFVLAASAGLCLSVCLAGCSRQMSSQTVAVAQDALNEAGQLLADGDAGGALSKIESALAGGLDADQAAQALLVRARCYAHQGDFEKAAADIEQALMGAPDEAMVQLTRGVLEQKQGNSSAAKKHFSAAKRLDPSIVIPSN
ncbi:MAG: hypothetical protein KDB22_21875 [Planctomycetales bacterium]|nr:hypothetical protein [Planctomycetales bacterium]